MCPSAEVFSSSLIHIFNVSGEIIPFGRTIKDLCVCLVLVRLTFVTCVATDINKFLWMVRIGGSTDTGRHIKEHDYYTPTGEFRVDREGSPVLLNCLMYKMCYYRFGQVYTEASKYSRLLPLKAKCVYLVYIHTA